ncbi:class I SAM-dependent methyltransferase [Micromonospora sp. NPDC047707]|uniref:methyltransferase domain-containing protein n=1 Tax=unclassified Micromonospora TaxID=2617518 RepID=UPI0012B48989|nr:class I SAM-dependent methyltransferase [Micromonospora sp. WMMC415]QGN49360.1 class I SAM-dependent methyltransferase [Micromonospora sp. WMMC415]
MALHSLRFRLVDAPTSLGAKRRARRAAWLADAFPDLADMSVLDLGGRVGSWERVPVRPARVHVVNLEPLPPELPDWAEATHADACDLPAHILARRYDLVFSNSVLEHVGGHERRRRMAGAIRGLAPAYWVQTPYRYFPIEPHWVAPGMQFLPVPARVVVARKWPLAYTPGKSYEAAMRQVLTTELVGRAEMRYLFPDATIRNERLLGLTKSLIAIRTA